MRTRFIVLSVIFIFTSADFISCKKKDKEGGGSKSSSYNDTSSHNVGSACLDCHNTGGANEFWFTIAGTVYKPDGTSLNPNSTVYLFSAANGTGNLILTLPVDGKGNFYTTSSLSFGSGLYPEVKSPSGATEFMQTPVTSGNCNSCHTSTQRITVN
jgi:hypothetical protein